jgi:tetratricopeptide (TPR) repeat protein
MGDPAACQCRNYYRRTHRLVGRLMLVVLLAAPILAQSQDNERKETGNKVVLGVRNQPLKVGAELLLAGNYEEGVEMTHKGLAQAFGSREEEAGLSNLCAGYLQLRKYDTALQYCNMLLVRNAKHWRGYNNRALIYIKTEQWEKADADLSKGEELNAGAYTMKVARSLYMDAVHPVAPEVEIDDREKKNREENK